MKEIPSNKLFIITKSFFIFAVLCLSQTANIFGYFNPFAFAILFAFVWSGENIFVLIGLYLSSSLCLGLNFFVLLPHMVCCLILLISALVMKKTQTQMTISKLILISLLSQIGRFFVYYSAYHIFLNVLEILIGQIVMVCCAKFFEAFMQRKTKLKLNADEVFNAGVFLFAISCGLGNLMIFNINFGLAIGVFLLLIFASVFGAVKGLSFANILGLGMFLATKNIVYLAALNLFALFGGLFISSSKTLSVISILCVLCIIGFYFNLLPLFNITNFVVFAVINLMVLLINKQTFSSLKLLFVVDSSIVQSNLIDIFKKVETLKLNQISKVFYEMDNVYKQMLKKSLTKEEAGFMLSKELCTRICEDCPKKQICFRKSGEDMLNHFFSLFNKGLEKKKIGLIDLPNQINSKCDKNQILLATANSLLNQFLQYDNMVEDINKSRLLISDQMGSVAKVIENLAKENNENLNVCEEESKMVLQDLIYNNITSCVDASVLKNKDNFIVIVSSLKEIDDVVSVEKVISKSLKIKMEQNNVLINNQNKIISYYFTSKSRCDLVFGCANASKNAKEESGDVHSLIKIDKNKYLLGICDGMGQGKQAMEISNQTVNLIENYYKAGFESENIINNVNKLFVAGNEEKFSTLDVCVLDLNSLCADFIKMGAPNTFIKKKNATQIISCGALPMGVIENVKPKLEKKMIEPKDIIFMVSDGISDSFKSSEELAFAINNLSGSNPQELADKLLNTAIEKNNGEIIDDMTVFVSRIYNKI